MTDSERVGHSRRSFSRGIRRIAVAARGATRDVATRVRVALRQIKRATVSYRTITHVALTLVAAIAFTVIRKPFLPQVSQLRALEEARQGALSGQGSEAG